MTLHQLRIVCEYLNDPHLVAKFQKYCGIFPLHEPQKVSGEVLGLALGRRSRSRSVGGDATVSSNGNGNVVNEDINCSDCKAQHRTSLKNHVLHRGPTDCADRKATPTTHPSTAADGAAVGNAMRESSSKKTRQYSNGDLLRNDSCNGHIDCTSDSTVEENTGYVIANKFLYYLFSFGASMGNEIFYITFFPFWFWNIDGYVGRRICVFWCIFMYLGQASKDIVKWPRPAAPPVFRMEKRYALEYGMPSTHAMVGAGIPFAILILTMNRYVYPFELGLITAIVWCIIVCLSRVYLGMHSILDVLVGLVYVFVLMLVVLPLLDHIDYFLLHAPHAPLIAVCLPLALCVLYPSTTRWSSARGDTTLILGVGAGIAVGNWLSVRLGTMSHPESPPPYAIIPPSLPWLGEVLVRLCLGSVMLVSTRAIVGACVRRLACTAAGIDPTNRHNTRRRAIELPYKFITYVAVAFNAVFLAPQVFRYLGIERVTYFTEM